MSWIKHMRDPVFGDHSYMSMEGFFMGFFRESLLNMTPIHNIEAQGSLTGDLDEVVTELEGIGLKNLIINHNPIKRNPPKKKGVRLRQNDGAHLTLFFSSENHDTLVQLVPSQDPGRDTYITAYTLNESIKDKLISLISKYIVEIQKGDGKVWSLSTSPGGGMEVKMLGTAGQSLERGNYSEEVLTNFDRAVRDLSSEDPLGRLVVIEGKPGTGKTFLVRGLIYETREMKHYLLPPSMIQMLGTPEFIPVLLEMAKEKEDGPSIFILEDADQCLVPRQADNMSAISSMLNLTDGILGRLVDIRLIVTTNASKVDMDPALLRSGRISSFMSVNELTPERASEVYQRVSGGKAKTYDRSAILADVYYEASEKPVESNDLVPVPKKSNRRVGFG